MNIEKGLMSEVFIDKSLLSSRCRSVRNLQLVTGLGICAHKAPRSSAASVTVCKKVTLAG